MKNITWKQDILEQWRVFIPPARPDKKEISIYASSIKKLKTSTPEILILGATPELRDCFLEKNLSVTCCDYSREHFLALKKLCTDKSPENFIESNWLDIPLNKQFDLIIGDHVVNVMKKEQIDKLINHLYRLLKNNGLIVLRTIIRLPDKYLYDPLSIINTYRRMDSANNFYTTTHYPFLHCTYNLKEDSIKLADTYFFIEKLFKQNLINKRELDEWAIRSKNISLKLFMPTLDYLKSIIENRKFKINNIWYGEEPYSKFVPIIFIQK